MRVVRREWVRKELAFTFSNPATNSKSHQHHSGTMPPSEIPQNTRQNPTSRAADMAASTSPDTASSIPSRAAPRPRTPAPAAAARAARTCGVLVLPNWLGFQMAIESFCLCNAT